MSYCGREKRIVMCPPVYCSECSREVSDGEEFYAYFYDYAIDADDGYGMYEEIPICLECGDE
jgi:hypothetical protein